MYSLLRRFVASPQVSGQEAGHISDDTDESDDEKVASGSASKENCSPSNENTDGSKEVTPKRVKRSSSRSSAVSLMSDSESESEPLEPSIDNGSDRKTRRLVKSTAGLKMNKKVLPALPKGTLYELEEDENILKYILENDGLDKVKGRRFWQDAESDYPSGYNRSWQSLKERFLKHIVHNLEGFEFLQDEEKEQINRAVSNNSK